MDKVIKISTNAVEIVDLPEAKYAQARLEWMYQQIGCEYIETVPTYRFDVRYQMVVDEEGKLNNAEYNPIASWLYGPGDVIVGTALLMKLTNEEDPDLGGMDEDEARHILRTIGDLITKVK